MRLNNLGTSLAVGLSLTALVSGTLFASRGATGILTSISDESVNQTQTDPEVIENAIKAYLSDYITSGELGRQLLKDPNFMDSLDEIFGDKGLSEILTEDELAKIANAIVAKNSGDISTMDKAVIVSVVKETVADELKSRSLTNASDFLTTNDIEKITTSVLEDVNESLRSDIEKSVKEAVLSAADELQVNTTVSDSSLKALEDNLKSYVNSTIRSSLKDGTDGINGSNGIDGKNGANGIDGKDGSDGINGTDGKDGNTPVKGVDYFTEDDIASIVAQTKSAIITNGTITIKGEKGDPGKTAYEVYKASVPSGTQALTETAWNTVIINSTKTIQDNKDAMDTINASYAALVEEYNEYVASIKDAVAEELGDQVADHVGDLMNNVEYYVNEIYNNTLQYTETTENGTTILTLSPAESDDIPYKDHTLIGD